MGRLEFYWGYLGSLRKWLVVGFAAMSNVSWLPDSAKNFIYHFFPDWRWQTWLLIAVVLLCAFILEEAHYRHSVAEAEKQSAKIPSQSYLVPTLSVAAIAILWLGSVVLRLHRIAETPESSNVAVAHASPSPSPAIQAPSPNPTTEKLTAPTKHARRKPNLKAEVKSAAAAEPDNAPIGNAQAPTAVAPNGIANAAPNLGAQTVNNFGEMPSPPLALTDAQCQSITTALGPFKSQTVAVIAQGYMGGDPFTGKLLECIQAAGMTVHYESVGTFQANFGIPPPGISFMCGDNRKDIVATLANTFWAIGLVNKPIKTFDIGSNEKAADAFTIFVSPLP